MLEIMQLFDYGKKFLHENNICEVVHTERFMQYYKVILRQVNKESFCIHYEFWFTEKNFIERDEYNKDYWIANQVS
jgi:hypothetical protein